MPVFKNLILCSVNSRNFKSSEQSQGDPFIAHFSCTPRPQRQKVQECLGVGGYVAPYTRLPTAGMHYFRHLYALFNSRPSNVGGLQTICPNYLSKLFLTRMRMLFRRMIRHNFALCHRFVHFTIYIHLTLVTNIKNDCFLIFYSIAYFQISQCNPNTSVTKFPLLSYSSKKFSR